MLPLTARVASCSFGALTLSVPAERKARMWGTGCVSLVYPLGGGGGSKKSAPCFLVPTAPPPPRVNGPGHVSSFERGGPLARGAMFLLSRGGVH